MTRIAAAFFLVIGVYAQENPLTKEAREDYTSIREYFIRAAEKMPEQDYSFMPVPEVRTFARLIAHVADDQYNLCAPVKGEKRQAAYSEIENTISTKADLVPVLRSAFAYCDDAYAPLTDRSANDVVQFGKTSRTKLSMLNWNTWHTWEHYGNVVVYLRMKRLVPPTSERKP